MAIIHLNQVFYVWWHTVVSAVQKDLFWHNYGIQYIVYKIYVSVIFSNSTLNISFWVSSWLFANYILTPQRILDAQLGLGAPIFLEELIT